jgi:hypothetical protein
MVRENNRTGGERQKEYYNPGNKLLTFQPGDLVYLKEMVNRRRGAKFKTRWKGPYEVIRRLSDLNYLIKLSRAKEIVVNLNKMKRCFRQPALQPTTERRSVRDRTEDKPETLVTYGTRYTGQDVTTDHSDTDTNDVTEKSTQYTDSDRYHFSRTRTRNCGDADVQEGRSMSPTYPVGDQTAESHRGVGDHPLVGEGEGGSASKSIATELAESGKA